MERQPDSRMCSVCGIDNPMGSMGRHRPEAQVLHRRRGPLHRPLPARAGAPGLSGAPAREDHQYLTGRPNPNSCTPWRSP